MKKIIILALLSALLLIAGCQQQATTATGYYKFTGAKAVDAKFLAGSPASSEVDTYQKNENIGVLLEIVNNLPEEIPSGSVRARLTGDAAVQSFFQGAKEATNPNMFAIDPETGVATPEEVELGPIRYIGDLPTKISKTITGQYCYEMPVKVKANLFYTDRDTEIGTNLPSGSNPPSTVQVTKIEQGTVNKGENNLGELRLKVTVQNLGTGTMISGLDNCFKYQDRTAREELTLEATGAYPITCGDGTVVLSRTDKSRTIDCKATGIDLTNLGKEASELTLTLSNFAYEEDLAPVTIWLEP